MRRRIVVVAVTFALAILSLPFLSEAQQTKKVPRIGFLVPASSASYSARIEAFRQGLRELGYVEGKNIAIEYRYAEGKLDRLPELAVELVRLKVDLIVAPGTRGALAAKQATQTIPIVFPLGLTIPPNVLARADKVIR